jgi:hypothetical protein
MTSNEIKGKKNEMVKFLASHAGENCVDSVVLLQYIFLQLAESLASRCGCATYSTTATANLYILYRTVHSTALSVYDVPGTGTYSIYTKTSHFPGLSDVARRACPKRAEGEDRMTQSANQIARRVEFESADCAFVLTSSRRTGRRIRMHKYETSVTFSLFEIIDMSFFPASTSQRESHGPVHTFIIQIQNRRSNNGSSSVFPCR